MLGHLREGGELAAGESARAHPVIRQADRVKRPMTRLSSGLGLAGIATALLIGVPILLPPLLARPTNDAWAVLLLIGATVVYVVLAAARERRRLPLTSVQLIVACALGVSAAATGASWLIAAGLLAHAAWDVWHLVENEKYVPGWYAGACVYVDLVAAGIVLTLHVAAQS